MTRFVSVIGTGLKGMGIESGARIQVTAVIKAVSTIERVERQMLPGDAVCEGCCGKSSGF